MVILGACGKQSAVTSTTSTTTTAKQASTTPAATTTAPSTTDKPKYGGTLNVVTGVNLEVFAPAVVARNIDLAGYVFEQLTSFDWSRGAAGTKEIDWGQGWGDFKYLTGTLAESFELPSLGVWKLKVRKGVHFALDPNSEASRLANGREMTPDDIIWSFRYINDAPQSWVHNAQPVLVKTSSIEKTGDWELTVKHPVDPWTGYCWQMGGGGSQYVWAPEVIQKYGTTNDWRQVVGTGPYMLTDFVTNSSATLKKNPNYWRKDPVGAGKGNQLPYPDQVKLLIIQDLSTQLAALRSGKADLLSGITRDDARELMRTNPDLKSYKYLDNWVNVIAMRTDKEDLPFKDQRVRRALMMATDFQSIRNNLYGGDAEINCWPLLPQTGNEDLFIPLDKLPGSAKELYTYSLDKAKSLLKDAGYPNGFKTELIVQNITTDVDKAEVFKAMWAKAGIDVDLQLKEGAVFRTISSQRSNSQMILRTIPTHFISYMVFSQIRAVSSNNPSYVNDPPGKDPIIEAAYQEAQKNVIFNMPKANQIYHDLIPHIIDEAYYIPTVVPSTYRFWQPWLKNYYGEGNLYIPFVWIDQNLKRSLGK